MKRILLLTLSSFLLFSSCSQSSVSSTVSSEESYSSISETTSESSSESYLPYPEIPMDYSTVLHNYLLTARYELYPHISDYENAFFDGIYFSKNYSHDTDDGVISYTLSSFGLDNVWPFKVSITHENALDELFDVRFSNLYLEDAFYDYLPIIAKGYKNEENVVLYDMRKYLSDGVNKVKFYNRDEGVAIEKRLNQFYLDVLDVIKKDICDFVKIIYDAYYKICHSDSNVELYWLLQPYQLRAKYKDEEFPEDFFYKSSFATYDMDQYIKSGNTQHYDEEFFSFIDEQFRPKGMTPKPVSKAYGEYRWSQVQEAFNEYENE